MRQLVALSMLVSSVVCGCASWVTPGAARQVGSVVEYLYPDAKEPPKMVQETTYLRPPVRVGLAFVPDTSSNRILSEVEKTRLLERVKTSFSKHSYIGDIEIIPSNYLRAKGGFTNLEQAARMFNVEVMTLVSYDQVQFNDTNALAVLYWTIVGAYVIHGDRYDIQTLVDASVFDVKSRKLLFRAPGQSQVKGSASMSGFSEISRQARTDGFNRAVDDLIPQLQNNLENFRERLKTDQTIKIENKAGYSGGGSLSWLELLILLSVASIGFAVRPKT
jgi:rhombotail lipoprotein